MCHDEGMSELYHVARPDGTQYGQMTKDEIQAKCINGTLPADTLVWTEGWADWRPADTLFQQAATPPTLPGTGAWGILSALQSVYVDRYCTFEGRAGRPEYWFAALGSIIVSFLALLLGVAIFLGVLALDETIGAAVGIGLLVLLGIALVLTIIPNIAVTVRRLHDAGFSGWFYLLSLIPNIGGLILLVFAVLPSAAPNRWGTGPEEPLR